MTPELDDAFASLRALNQPVPIQPTLPNEQAVDQALAAVGVDLHPDLRRYLLEASDIVYGTKEPVRIGGSRDFITTVADARQVGVHQSSVPICDDNGDYYCIEPTGEIVYWSHNGTTDETWPDLATWIMDVWIGES